MNRTRIGLLVSLLSTVALVGCTPGGGATSPEPSGSPAPSPSPSVTGIAHPTGAGDLVVRIEYTGGFVAPGWILTQLPVISIYGDGLVVTQGPQIEIYPAPALPSIISSRLSEAGLQRVLEAARTAGLLGPDRRFENPGIADASTAVFTVVAGGTTHTTSAYALHEGEDSPSVPAAERVARAELIAFAAKLGELTGWLGSDVVAAEAPYEYVGLRVFVTAARPDPSSDIEPSFADWPLKTALDEFGSPMNGFGQVERCGVVSGDDLATLRAALQRANALTFWRSSGDTFQLGLRPLLPGESGCPQGR